MKERDSFSYRLFPEVYEALRGLAHTWFRHLTPGLTLQPTALVHEAFLRLAGNTETTYEDRAHFLAVATTAMRRLLFNYLRDRKARKRGGDVTRITLSEAIGAPAGTVDAFALVEALEHLAVLDQRRAQIVEMRFLAGLKIEEIARVLGLSSRTVKRSWRTARAWLAAELKEGRHAARGL